MYRIVADTNIVVSGLLWGGKPRLLLELAIAQQIVLCATEILLDELFDVVARPRFAGKLVQAGTSPAELLADYRFLVEIVIPVEIGPHVLADPDDDAVLACALAAKADFIASGDNHLLSLQTYQGIPILTVHDLWTRIN